MNMKLQFVAMLFSLVCCFTSPAFGQGEPTKEAGAEQAKTSSELDYVTPEYMGLKKFWSDDAAVVFIVLAGVVAVGGIALYSANRKRKEEDKANGRG